MSKDNKEITVEQAVTVATTIANEQLEINQVLGRVQSLQAVASFVETFSLTQLAQIKEQKLYRKFNNQTMIIDGVEIRLNTWEGFCKAINSNRITIEDKLANLRLLGEETLERVEALGMTTRELRKLRQLDSTDQKVIISEIEVNTGDKESIIELIEDMSVKHNKAKEELEKQLAEQKEQTDIQKRLVAQKEKKINDLDKEIVRQEKMTVPEQEAQALNILNGSFNLCRGAILDIGVKVTNALEFDSPAAQQSCLGSLLILRNEIDRIFAENELHGVLMDTSDAALDDIVDKAMQAIDGIGA